MTTFSSQRIELIDMFRGFAVLGLLCMNTISFAMPIGAYLNPYAYLPDSFLNVPLFYFMHIFADQKFMGIFSLLFGVSAYLLLLKQQDSPTSSHKDYFVRNLWLVIFGLAHGILIWKGDVLLIYGLSAFILYFFRNVSAFILVAAGLCVYLIPNVFFIDLSMQLAELSAEDIAWLNNIWQPNPDSLRALKDIFRGDYLSQLTFRVSGHSNKPKLASELLTFYLFIDGFGRAFGMMLVGMGLFKLGVFTSHCSKKLNLCLIVLGLLVGMSLIAVGIYANYQHEFSATYGLFNGRMYNNMATPFMVMSYLCLFNLLVRCQGFTLLKFYLSAVGKLALTNYLAQSLLASLIFYGWGLAWYGQLNRAEVYLLIPVIACLQIVFSVFWLMHFRYGPIEWIWRVLTQGPVSIRRT